MMGKILEACARTYGRLVARLAAGAIVLGAAAFVAGLASGRGETAFGALAASWLFCAGISAGGVAVAAAVRVARGRWARIALPVGESTSGFFISAWALLAVLVLAAQRWMPEMAKAGVGEELALAGRNLGAAALLFWAGKRFLARVRADAAAEGVSINCAGGQASPRKAGLAGLSASNLSTRFEPSREAVVYLLLYALALTVWAMDLVMALHAWAPSTVIPAFYFMSAFLGGLAWIALVGVLRPGGMGMGPDERHDLGKLLFAFCLVWAYLLWSAFLPTWYANLPDEMGQFQVRWTGGWKLLSTAVLVALALPLVLLLPEGTKRHRVTLAVAASSVLVGLLAEAFLLVLPSLPAQPGAVAIAVAAATALGPVGLMVVTAGAKLAASPSAAEGSPAPDAPRTA